MFAHVLKTNPYMDDRSRFPSKDKAVEEAGYAMQKKVTLIVGNHLQNTPTIAFKDYISPKVWPKLPKLKG